MSSTVAPAQSQRVTPDIVAGHAVVTELATDAVAVLQALAPVVAVVAKWLAKSAEK